MELPKIKLPFSKNLSSLSRLDSTSTFDGNTRLISAENELVQLSDGDGVSRTLIDLMSSYGAVNFGHKNPDIKPFSDYKADLVAFFMPEEAERYASWLCNKINKPNSKVLFQVGGAFAVSSALSLSMQNRPGKVVSIRNGFHGLGIDALSATTLSKENVLQESAVRQMTKDNFQIIEQGEEIKNWNDISCILFEPVQGAAGLVPINEDWLRHICGIAKEKNIITISDEVQCGYYRCGELSYSNRIGIEPNITLFGKSVTNGLFPYSVIVYDQFLEQDRSPNIPVFSHTYQPSALGCYCAFEVAKYIENHDVKGDVSRVNKILSDFSNRLESQNITRNAHALGPSLSMEYLGVNAGKISHSCFDKGVLLTTGGKEDSRFRIMPPLTIPSDSLLKALDIVEQEIYKDFKK